MFLNSFLTVQIKKNQYYGGIRNANGRIWGKKKY